jgi:hypothetical protein
MRETEIDGRIVPIEPGPKIIITFSAGQEGPQGAGTFEFWVSVSPPLGDCVRCREGQTLASDSSGWKAIQIIRKRGSERAEPSG